VVIIIILDVAFSDKIKNSVLSYMLTYVLDSTQSYDGGVVYGRSTFKDYRPSISMYSLFGAARVRILFVAIFRG